MRRRHAVAFAAAAMAAACGTPDDGDRDAGADAASSIDAVHDGSADDARGGDDAIAGDDGSGADSDAAPVETCGPDGPTRIYVLKTLRFARNNAGISNGFDLDDRVSNATDTGGCRKVDLTTPDGTPGVDNQFASLLPAIEATGGIAFEGLIQNAINAGNILLLVEVSGLDDHHDDSCVSVAVVDGQGEPLLDAEGGMEAGQTFARSETPPPPPVTGAIAESTLLADGLSLTVPAYVFFYEFRVPIQSARLSMTIADDGTATGVVAGAVLVETLIEIVSQIDGADGVPDAVIALAPGLADLFPGDDGKCQAVSAALEFEAVPAFFYE
jgi:hypothetical protein